MPYIQDFEGVTPPALPSDWTGDTQATTSAPGGGYPGQALTLGNISGVTRWVYHNANDTGGGDIQFLSKDVRLNTAGAILRVVSRLSGAAAASYTGYSVLLWQNNGVSIWKAVGGVETQLGAQVNLAIPLNTSLTVSFVCRGTNLTCQIQRQDTGQWLQPDGTWGSTQQDCISRIDGTIIGVGKNGYLWSTGAAAGILVGESDVNEATPATAYTLNGPTWWMPATAAAYTVTSNGFLSSPVTVTVVATNGSVSGTVTIPTGYRSSATFTYTPAAVGIGTLTLTNNGGLANPDVRTVTIRLAVTRLFTQRFDVGYSGLAGTVGLTLIETTGDTHRLRFTAAILEDSATGTYFVTQVVPSGWPGFPRWDTGGSAPAYGYDPSPPPVDESLRAGGNPPGGVGGLPLLVTDSGAGFPTIPAAVDSWAGFGVSVTASVAAGAFLPLVAAQDLLGDVGGKVLGGGGTPIIGVGAMVSAFPGAGAFSVTITVNDGANPLQSAFVRVTKGIESYVLITNSSGQVVFGLNAGTWTVAAALAGYQFAGANLVVSANVNQTYSMTVVVITPSPVGQVTGYGVTYDENGLPESGVSVTITVKSIPSTLSGVVLDQTPRTVTSRLTDGVYQFTGLFKGVTYNVSRGDGKQFPITIPVNATDPTQLPSFYGSP